MNSRHTALLAVLERAAELETLAEDEAERRLWGRIAAVRQQLLSEAA